MRKIKKIALTSILATSLVTLTACSSFSGDAYVTTKTGDITSKEILESLGSEQISKTTTDLTIRKILLDKYKGAIDEKQVEKQLEEDQNQYGGKEAFEAALAQKGFSIDRYKEALRVRFAQAHMINEFQGVTEETLKTQHESDKLQYNLAHILIPVKTETNPTGLSEEEAKTKINEIKQKLDSGEDFATLAKANSADSSATNGGELGWSSKSSTSFVPEFAEVAYNTEKGKHSDPVKTQFGYHIIKVLDTKESSFEEVKSELAETVANKAVAEDPTVYSKALKKIFEEYNVKFNNEDVKTYVDTLLNAGV